MAILRDYEKRAEEIMTPEWKKRIQRNRLLFQSQYHLQQQQAQEVKTDDGQARQMRVPVQPQNIEPWLFQINVEFVNMTAPLDEMKNQFYHEVMNLATPEQREAVAGDLGALASAHGMEQAMVEAVVGFLFQPSDAKGPGEQTSETEPAAGVDQSSTAAEPVEIADTP
jgi:hypothetical protein